MEVKSIKCYKLMKGKAAAEERCKRPLWGVARTDFMRVTAAVLRALFNADERCCFYLVKSCNVAALATLKRT